jgi:hypothetical protein
VISLGVGFVGLLAIVVLGGFIVPHSSLPDMGQGAKLSFRLGVVWSRRSHINCFSLDRCVGLSVALSVCAGGSLRSTLGPGGRPGCFILCSPGGGGFSTATNLVGRARP